MTNNIDDTMRRLFAELPDEPLPQGFNENLMLKIRHQVSVRAKRVRMWGIIGYIAGGIAVITVYILLLMYMKFDVKSFFSYNLPPLKDLLTYPSFRISLYAGMPALILLIADTIIRHQIWKKHRDTA